MRAQPERFFFIFGASVDPVYAFGQPRPSVWPRTQAVPAPGTPASAATPLGGPTSAQPQENRIEIFSRIKPNTYQRGGMLCGAAPNRLHCHFLAIRQVIRPEQNESPFGPLSSVQVAAHQCSRRLECCAFGIHRLWFCYSVPGGRHSRKVTRFGALISKKSIPCGTTMCEAH